MSKLLVMIAIVAASAAGSAAAQTTPETLVDNPSIRITVRTVAPGSGTGRHQSIESEVGIVAEGEVTLDSPEGQSVIREGAAYWVPGLTPHDSRNDGTRPVKLFEIFLKRCD